MEAMTNLKLAVDNARVAAEKVHRAADGAEAALLHLEDLKRMILAGNAGCNCPAATDSTRACVCPCNEGSPEGCTG